MTTKKKGAEKRSTLAQKKPPKAVDLKSAQRFFDACRSIQTDLAKLEKQRIAIGKKFRTAYGKPLPKFTDDLYAKMNKAEQSLLEATIGGSDDHHDFNVFLTWLAYGNVPSWMGEKTSIPDTKKMKDGEITISRGLAWSVD